MKRKFLEDFSQGQTYPLGPVTITEQEIIEFARHYDPAPFHLDPIAAKNSMLGGLIASGWHTCVIANRLICDQIYGPQGSSGGPGIDRLKWSAPVYPQDCLSGLAKVDNVRQSNSNPKIGFVKFHTVMHNQKNKTVLIMEYSDIFECRSHREGHDHG